MTELLISEITLMKKGACVIGLERTESGLRSLRPIPRSSFAWHNFPYARGDKVAFNLFAMPACAPHIEDRLALHDRKVGAIAEAELVSCLKQAEVSTSIAGLFGYKTHWSNSGSDAVYIRPEEGQRSICGCSVASISFSFKFYPPKIRVALHLHSGERLGSLPVVDSQWVHFANHLSTQSAANLKYRSHLQNFFDSFVRNEIMASPIRFARIGLSRPDKDGCCWLMLDSLFPLPKQAWLREFP